MSFIVRVGAVNFPVATDTVNVYDTGTTNEVPSLIDLDGSAIPSQPIVVPASGFWGFDTPDDRQIDVYWNEGARNLVEKAIVKRGSWIPEYATDPVSPQTGDKWVNTTDVQLKIKTATGTIVFNAFQFIGD